MEATGERFAADDQRDDTTARRAIVLIAVPAPATLTAEIGPEPAASIAVYTLLDLLAVLTPLDGVFLAVACADREHTGLVAGLLPAGINMYSAPSGEATSLDAMLWALSTHFERGFDRVLALMGDVVDLPSRTAATALGTLVSVDVAIGPTRDGGLYLIGAKSAAGAALLDDTEPTSSALSERVRVQGLTARRVEPRRRLAELANVQAIRDVAIAHAAALPRLNMALRRISPPAK
ncbi:MAG: DUF2064 domain-containing protein [Chloroflexota bacterium]|nr:DUF2064 domain-containing protein [Chloroflexota bacterium]